MNVVRSLLNRTTAPILAIAAVWFFAVAAQGFLASNGWTLARFDFSLSGAFGDSFGPLSAFMATLAAASALIAFSEQRKELQELAKDRTRDRASAYTRDFETTFFSLLDLLRTTVQELSSHDLKEKRPKSGRAALKQILQEHLEDQRSNFSDDQRLYDSVYATFRDELGHYFRTLYHIVNFIHKSKINDKMMYVRFLRATLSNAEIVLLGLNCEYGGGREKFKKLVEKYALLHNVSSSYAERWNLTRKFGQSAFGNRKVDKKTGKLGR